MVSIIVVVTLVKQKQAVEYAHDVTYEKILRDLISYKFETT